MNNAALSARVESAYQTALAALMAARNAEGYWVGELSSSALSTATATFALGLMDQRKGTAEHRSLIENGFRWLLEHQNADGGWGDTIRSLSNISTTMLCRAALAQESGVRSQELGVGSQESGVKKSLLRAAAYLDQTCGAGAANQAEAIRRRYGKDRTFSVPILMMAALAGLVEWKEVPRLPFELACFPQSWFRFLRMPVVSYALPALIAIGQAVHYHRKPWNPVTRIVRRLARQRSLRVLERIQPSSGGFLEAIPLTSFVVMSLASIGQENHAVAKKGVEFLVNSVRSGGSWAIDSNLSVWVTTLAVNALATAFEHASLANISNTIDWLIARQERKRHQYTGAEPGAWGWTHLPGSVPDADDTPGALMALVYWASENSIEKSAIAGIAWLTRMQNHDGGWPTFCKGWGTLPFDRSGSDLTAHAIRALVSWSHSYFGITPLDGYERPDFPLKEPEGRVYRPICLALPRGLTYLARSQRPDGSWLPLWFGNQHAPNDENPTYGTARVLAAYRDLGMMNEEPARRGVEWLIRAQNPDGSWGGAPGVPGSIEETALAVEILLDAPITLSSSKIHPICERGLTWLADAIEAGRLEIAEPIGFYFAKLWYFERLYPIIFSVAALGRARRKLKETF